MCVLSYYYIFVEHYSQHECKQTNKTENKKNMKLSLKRKEESRDVWILYCRLLSHRFFYNQIVVQNRITIREDIIKTLFGKLS